MSPSHYKPQTDTREVGPPPRPQTHAPASEDGGHVEPGWILINLWLVLLRELRDVVDGEAVDDVALHSGAVSWVVGVVVDQAWDHVRGEGHDEGLGEPMGSGEAGHMGGVAGRRTVQTLIGHLKLSIMYTDYTL